MPQLDTATYLPQLYWLAVCFVVLYVIISRLALPRITRVLERRHDKIAGDLEAAEKLRDEAKAALAEYEAAVERARAEAQAILAKAINEHSLIAIERESKLSARLAKELAAAEKRVVDAKNKALAEIETEAGKLARAVIEKLVGGRVDAKTVAAAVKSAKRMRA